MMKHKRALACARYCVHDTVDRRMVVGKEREGKGIEMNGFEIEQVLERVIAEITGRQVSVAVLGDEVSVNIDGDLFHYDLKTAEKEAGMYFGCRCGPLSEKERGEDEGFVCKVCHEAYQIRRSESGDVVPDEHD